MGVVVRQCAVAVAVCSMILMGIGVAPAQADPGPAFWPSNSCTTAFNRNLQDTGDPYLRSYYTSCTYVPQTTDGFLEYTADSVNAPNAYYCLYADTYTCSDYLRLPRETLSFATTPGQQVTVVLYDAYTWGVGGPTPDTYYDFVPLGTVVAGDRDTFPVG